MAAGSIATGVPSPLLLWGLDCSSDLFRVPLEVAMVFRSGPMQAALSQENQLLGSLTPSLFLAPGAIRKQIVSWCFMYFIYFMSSCPAPRYQHCSVWYHSSTANRKRAKHSPASLSRGPWRGLCRETLELRKFSHGAQVQHVSRWFYSCWQIQIFGAICYLWMMK